MRKRIINEIKAIYKNFFINEKFEWNANETKIVARKSEINSLTPSKCLWVKNENYILGEALAQWKVCRLEKKNAVTIVR